jgi:hypothetical protein
LGSLLDDNRAGMTTQKAVWTGRTMCLSRVDVAA